ncbi:MAG TPA: thiamine diphosphokinase [Rhizobiaceae bacterium]|nr:thiamine diphosphokinase [Rhizobiaceae bacterium]
MTLFAVLLDGECAATPRLQRQITGARVIAADGGIRHAAALGVMPELWLGDFDSAGNGFDAAYRDVERRRFPAAKDATDGELAVREALARGAARLVLCGALGGPRSDHALLNLVQASQLQKHGLEVLLASGREEAAPLGPSPRHFDLPAGTVFSVVGLTDLAGLTIRGAEWPLTDAVVPFGTSRTLSNTVKGNGGIEASAQTGTATLLAHLSS